MARRMTTAPLRISAPTLERTGDRLTLSGEVEGSRLFWTMPPRDAITLRGEPFVVALLVSAMRSRRDLILPDTLPLDPGFAAGLAEQQEIFARWFPELRAVRIEAARAERHGPTGRYTGYSAGVDSSYTVMQLQSALDGVVLVDGIEYGIPNPALMSGVDEALRRTMAARGLPLVTVQTNAKWIGKATGGKWSHFIGGSLASVPHALGVTSYAIAGSNSWENLRPYGTHPLTDPRWSSAATAISHHGAGALRIEKLAMLAAAPDLLAVLRVCFQGTEYNCGTCHKCLQTSAAMRATGLTSPAMPALVDPRLLRTIAVEHDGDLVDWEEILPVARARGDGHLVRELSRLVNRFHWRQATRRLDELATGGLMRRLLGG